MSKVLLLQGNQAVVEGAIAAGVKFFAGYPIKTKLLPWALLSVRL